MESRGAGFGWSLRSRGRCTEAAGGNPEAGPNAGDPGDSGWTEGRLAGGGEGREIPSLPSLDHLACCVHSWKPSVTVRHDGVRKVLLLTQDPRSPFPSGRAERGSRQDDVTVPVWVSAFSEGQSG